VVPCRGRLSAQDGRGPPKANLPRIKTPLECDDSGGVSLFKAIKITESQKAALRAGATQLQGKVAANARETSKAAPETL
jgi:hypothetical protein